MRGVGVPLSRPPIGGGLTLGDLALRSGLGLTFGPGRSLLLPARGLLVAGALGPARGLARCAGLRFARCLLLGGGLGRGGLDGLGRGLGFVRGGLLGLACRLLLGGGLG